MLLSVLTLWGRMPLLYAPAAARPPCVRHRNPEEKLVRTFSLEEMREMLTLFGATPAEILNDDVLLKFFSKPVQCDLAMSQEFEFVPTPPLAVPIVFYGGLFDPLPVADLDDWRTHSSRGFRRETIRGSHFFLQDATEELVNSLLSHVVPKLLDS
eukprot:TRINITY_DN450_c0_g1_i1.p2 TRINITY_DN450_c0_g1~~TRINITY_DN450_c0_g1_i1.p2  ORF type:complete len:155 (-),score=29.49 TRINITY_DN450_c0_g1_i1:52-516(-)